MDKFDVYRQTDKFIESIKKLGASEEEACIEFIYQMETQVKAIEKEIQVNK